MPGSVKVGGSWKTVAGASVKVGGAWKTVAAGYTKVGGVWKQWLSSFVNIAGPWWFVGMSDFSSKYGASLYGNAFAENGTVFTGGVYSERNNAMLMAHDISGNRLWWKTYNFNGFASGYGTQVVNLAVGPDNLPVFLISAGSSHLVLVKFSATGTPLWATKILNSNTAGKSYSYVTVDSANNVIVSTTYSIGPGVYYISITKTNGSTGAGIWERRISGGSVNLTAGDLTTDSSNNIYTVFGGYISSTFNTVQVKIDTNGNLLIMKRIPGNQNPASDIQIDSSNNIYVNSKGGDAARIFKYAPDFSSTVWSRQYQSGSMVWGMNIKKTNDNLVYATIYASSGFRIHIFAINDSDGSYTSQTSYATLQQEINYFGGAPIDGSGNVYLSGKYSIAKVKANGSLTGSWSAGGVGLGSSSFNAITVGSGSTTMENYSGLTFEATSFGFGNVLANLRDQGPPPYPNYGKAAIAS
jgi:hypothetical protein